MVYTERDIHLVNTCLMKNLLKKIIIFLIDFYLHFSCDEETNLSIFSTIRQVEFIIFL